MDLIWVVPGASALAVLFSIWLAKDVLRRDTGTPAMQEVAGMIFEGAMAFLKRQYRTIGLLALAMSLIIAVVVGLLGEVSAESADVSQFELGLLTGVAFIVGALCSGLAGFIGMYISVKANLRTASAAQRSFSEALTVALRGGAVSGFLVVALSLIGVAAIYYIYGGADKPEQTPFLIVGFGFGASFVALFAQLGGGIYTKAADVGSDLVGKVEAGIPEDDPRNAAVVADLVGDNVGDCAGRGADLFESTAAENIGAMILGVAVFLATGNEEWILFPLVVRAFGLIACIAGVMFVRPKENEDPMAALNRGYYVVALLSAGFLALVTYVMLDEWLWFFASGMVGIAVSIAFIYITQYYTAGSWRPVKDIAESSKTGPATNFISGIAVGLETTFSTAVVIGIGLFSAYWLGEESGVDHGGVYGTAVATMAMLMSAAYVLAMDTFGPITDNAGGITQMSGSSEKTREITDRLDTAGNTTKALTKGYAMGSAALAAFLLFQAFLDEVAKAGEVIESVNLAEVEVFIAALLGVMLVFLFSSLAIKAVGRAASSIIEEVRRQFRERPGIMAGTERPDFARCVDITTIAALRQMVVPGLLAVGAPIVVGLIFRAEGAAGFLMAGTIGGIILATVFNNAGGSWDNAKKYIEAGNLKEGDEVMGKGSDAHKAAVAGDTVGDPLKDTAGPSLHVLVKLLATVTLVMAPLFV
ncbi:MAG: sodium-translocating pyrophosphatase [SAR202 cluster bacterium]|nr:sodium-translocating pyrophosphatase [SAR202 cluster bacterium]